jgi:hypothetical protein
LKKNILAVVWACTALTKIRSQQECSFNKNPALSEGLTTGAAYLFELIE